MRKNVAGQSVDFQMIAIADGSDVTTGTPSVYYKLDGGARTLGVGAASHDGSGGWEYLPTQAETNGDKVSYQMILTNAVTQIINVWPVSFDPTDAVDLGLTNLDATVSSRMPTTHIDATAGKVDGVALVDTTTSNTDMRGTDGANTVIPDAAGVAPTAVEIRTEIDTNSTKLDVTVSSRMPTTHISATTGKVDGVALVDVTTTNTDMRGTDGAATAVDLTTAQADLDIITGADGALFDSTAQASMVDDVWDEPLTGATHNVATSAGRRLRGLQDFQTYSSYVWVDTLNGTAGVVAGENGTENNPVLTWADALTLAADPNTPYFRFFIVNQSAIILSSSSIGYTLNGSGWSLALTSQDISDALIKGAKVSGTATTATGHAHLTDCELDLCTLGNIHCLNAVVNSTINMSAIGDYLFVNSQSGVAGIGQPTFNFAAVGAQNLALRDWDGSVELQNMSADDNCSIDGSGRKIIINANCTGGTLVVAGFFELEDNSGGAVTVIDIARYASDDLVDLIWDEILTGGTHNISDSAGKRIRDLQEFGSYEGGAVFIDTVNGAAGATDYENGTVLNPVNTMADANTLAASPALKLSRFAIAPASAITFTAPQVSQVFKGTGWSVTLGGQDISDTEIIGAQSVSGIATSPTGEAHFVDCELVTGSLGQAHLKFCGLSGTLTLTAAANYTASNCYSQIAGDPTPIIDFGAAIGATGFSMRHYSGGIEIQNYGATGIDTMSLEGNGQLVIAASCLGGTIYVRGNFKVTDNSGGAVTVVYDSNTANIASILTDTSELQTDWTDGGRLDLILDAINTLSVAIDGKTTNLPVDPASETNVDANETKIDNIQIAVDALNDISVADILTTAMTESYVAKGAEVSIAQALYEALAVLMERDNAGTTSTFNKRDGVTPAFTGTLDDATNPTSVTRTS